MTTWHFGASGQFVSTASNQLFNEVPKAKHIGDTVYTQVFSSFSYYVLEKIDRSGRYVYRGLEHYKKRLKITYDAHDRVQSYYYKFRQWGGSGKGFFVIHYYPNGAIKDYANIESYVLFQPGELYLYDSLQTPPADRDKIPHVSYNAYKRRGKVYLASKGYLEGKALRKLLRKGRRSKPVHLIEDFPYTVYLVD